MNLNSFNIGDVVFGTLDSKIGEIVGWTKSDFGQAALFRFIDGSIGLVPIPLMRRASAEEALEYHHRQVPPSTVNHAPQPEF